MSDDSGDVPTTDFIGELKRTADAIKAAAEAIRAVESIIGIFERSATLEIRNTTGRKLLLFDHVHEHGGFAVGPEPAIEANRSVVLGTRSSGFLTGTEGAARYNIEGTDIFFTINWDIPFAGGNEASCSVSGDESNKLVVFTIGANGNTNVPLKYLIGERAALGPKQPDWRMCDKCKCLYFAPAIETSDCPAGGRHSHNPTSLNFQLRHGIPGVSHQENWRRCVRCAGLFFNGVPNKKGLCPAPVKPIHAEEEGFVLSHTQGEDVPSDPTNESLWRFCIECFGLYSEPENRGGCPANQNGLHARFPDPGTSLPITHPLAGVLDKRPFNYRLRHGVVPDPADHSVGWRRCRKCSVLFFEPELDGSDCSVGGTHEAAADSPVFQISGVEPAKGDFLGGWSKCRRCKGMFFPIRAVDRGGRCPRPNPPGFRLGHKASQFQFHLPHDFEGPGQNGWRFCNKCFGLVFEPQLSEAVPCPAGGAHVPQGFDFRLNP